MAPATYHGESLDDRLGEFKKRAAEAGIRVRVGEVFRSNERQHELYEQGRSKPGGIVTNADRGESLHNGRHSAFDADPVDGSGKVITDPKVYAQLGQIARAIGMVWGGDFKNLKGDLRHFELPTKVAPPPIAGVPIPRELVSR